MRGHSRAVGIALGSVPTFLLHEAPCSVLVVRDGIDPETWPRAIVVGVDGSGESEVALGGGLRARGAVRRLAARNRGHARGARRARRGAGVSPDVAEVAGGAVDELSHAGEHADLVVVGSRGLTGIRSLGSVSERVAHDAPCPVLVVRLTAP